MAESNEFKLKETESHFKFAGIVTGTTAQNCFRKGEFEKGKNKGKNYQSIRFGVQTRPDNTLYTELFGSERDFVWFYKPAKSKTQKGTTLKKPFSERNNPPKGYHLIGMDIQLEKDKAGKLIRKNNLTEFDATEYIYDNIEDGISVQVEGKIQFNEYNDKIQTQFVIEKIKRIDDINFDSPDFKEVNSFSAEIVFTGSEVDDETKKVFVSAYQIGYGDRYREGQFVVDPSCGVKDIKKTAKAFTSLFKFGDTFKVYGVAINTVIEEVVESEEEQDDADVVDVFGGEVPEGADEDTVIKTYITELRITSGDNKSYQLGKGKYTEDDFVPDEEEEEENNEEDASSDDDDSDDLPF